MELKIKKINKDTIIPTKSHKSDAGFDLYFHANNTNAVLIPPHETLKCGTGIAVEIPQGYFGGVFARSGLSTKQGLRPANCVGVIDSNYRGEIIVPLHNDTESFQCVNTGDRIAQLIILPYPEIELKVVDELGKSDRDINGFGSTGK